MTPARAHWATPERDAALLAHRAAGRNWGQIALAMQTSTSTLCKRWRDLTGHAAEPRKRRPVMPRRPVPEATPAAEAARATGMPLAAGVPVSWQAITRGTCLEGKAYRK